MSRKNSRYNVRDRSMSLLQGLRTKDSLHKGSMFIENNENKTRAHSAGYLLNAEERQQTVCFFHCLFSVFRWKG